MDNSAHYRKLEQMYLSAPINAFYEPEITVSEGEAKVTMKVQEKFFHAAHALHGAVFFKMLDDAAFFAANSVVTDHFVITSEFHLHFLRPIKKGTITSIGKLLLPSKNLFVAEARLYDDDENEMAFGSGSFVKSKLSLDSGIGYS